LPLLNHAWHKKKILPCF